MNWHRLYQIAALCGAFGCVDIQLYVVWGVVAANVLFFLIYILYICEEFYRGLWGFMNVPKMCVAEKEIQKSYPPQNRYLYLHSVSNTRRAVVRESGQGAVVLLGLAK